MTQQEFNAKYKQWIPEGWSGLDFDKPEVTEYMDKTMQDMVLIPGFELHQIKMKFDWPRFYFTTSFKYKAFELAIAMRVQEDINRIMKGEEVVDRWKRVNTQDKEGSTKLFSRMDVIGQNGNEGTHYEETWMELEYYDEYQKALTTGMFFEWFPNLTGEWSKDKYWFCHEMRKIKRSNDKEIKG
jgi:hypothetical protein